MPFEFLDDKDKKILDLDSRKRIYDIVKKFAGCHFREIERKSKLSAGSVNYHLGYLNKHGLIKGEKENNYIRYFPKEFKSENKRLLSFLRQKSTRRILIFILTNNNCNHEQIVKFVKLSPSTVSWHLKKLEEEGIIRSIKYGRKTYYDLLIKKNEIINLLITYKESFFDSLVNNAIEMWLA